MIEQELKNIWKDSSQVDIIKFDISRLIIELDDNISRLEKQLKNRDLRETIIAYFMIPVCGYYAYELPFVLSKVGASFLVIWCIYVILKFRDIHKKKKPIDVSKPFKDQLLNQRQNILDQTHLLDSILYWYILPVIIGSILVVLGFGTPINHEWSHPLLDGTLHVSMVSKITVIIISLLFAGLIYWMNKRVIIKKFNPIIDKIDRLQAQMDEL